MCFVLNSTLMFFGKSYLFSSSLFSLLLCFSFFTYNQKSLGWMLHFLRYSLVNFKYLFPKARSRSEFMPLWEQNWDFYSWVCWQMFNNGFYVSAGDQMKATSSLPRAPWAVLRSSVTWRLYTITSASSSGTGKQLSGSLQGI